MEWVIKNIETGEYAQVQSEIRGDRTIIFNSAEQAENFLKRAPEDFQSVAVIIQIVACYGPKISCEDAIKELYEEEEE